MLFCRTRQQDFSNWWTLTHTCTHTEISSMQANHRWLVMMGGELRKAHTLWVYKNECIREWISNRHKGGGRMTKTASPVTVFSKGTEFSLWGYLTYSWWPLCKYFTKDFMATHTGRAHAWPLKATGYFMLCICLPSWCHSFHLWRRF